jgi:hypothetical protein
VVHSREDHLGGEHDARAGHELPHTIGHEGPPFLSYCVDLHAYRASPAPGDDRVESQRPQPFEPRSADNLDNSDRNAVDASTYKPLGFEGSDDSDPDDPGACKEVTNSDSGDGAAPSTPAFPHSSFSSDRLLDLKLLVPSPAPSPISTSPELPPSHPDATTKLSVVNTSTRGTPTSPTVPTTATTRATGSPADSNAPHPAVSTIQEQQVQSKTSHPANTSTPPTSAMRAACPATHASIAATAEAVRRDLGSLSREEIPPLGALYPSFPYSLRALFILTGLVFLSVFSRFVPYPMPLGQPRAPSEAAATAYAVKRSERSVTSCSVLSPLFLFLSTPDSTLQVPCRSIFHFTRSASVLLSTPSFPFFSYPPRVYPSFQSSRFPRDPVPVAGDSKFFSREEDPGTRKSGACASPEARSDPTPTPAQGPSRARGRPPPPPARQVGEKQAVPRNTTPAAAPSMVYLTRKCKHRPSKQDDFSDDDSDFASTFRQSALPLRPDQRVRRSMQARIRRIAQQRALHPHQRSVMARSDQEDKHYPSKQDDFRNRLTAEWQHPIPERRRCCRRSMPTFTAKYSTLGVGDSSRIPQIARDASSQMVPWKRSRVGNASDSQLPCSISSERRQLSGQVYKGRPSRQDDFPDDEDDFAPSRASVASSPAAPSAAPIPTRITSPLFPAPCITTQSAPLSKARSSRERKRRSSKHSDFSSHRPDHSAIWCNAKASSVPLDSCSSTAERQIQAETRSDRALRPCTRTASTDLSNPRDSASAGREAPADSPQRRHRTTCSGTSGDRQDLRPKSIACLGVAFFDLSRVSSPKRTDSGDSSRSRGPTSPARGEPQRVNDRSQAERVARYRHFTTQASARSAHLSEQARVSVEHTHKRRTDQDQSDIAELEGKCRQRVGADHSKQLGLQRGGTTPAIGRHSGAPDSTRQDKRKTTDEIATEADWGQSVAQ